MQDKLIIHHAREHNLKNISLEIPRDSFTVFTGVSGSGKSSLAFDTIYQEGQRRYMESLSAYARQYLGSMEKPDVESIQGLSPTVCIDQKTVNRNPRSTVGTVTEIYDHFRLLYARLGQVQCPVCGKEIQTQTPDRIADRILTQKRAKMCMILAPIVQERKGEYRKELETLRAEGFTKVRIDGKIQGLEEDIQLKRYEKHTLEVLIDRIVLLPINRSRFIEALEKAIAMTKGTFSSLIENDYTLESIQNACATCGVSFPEIEPRLFSFNNPVGACERCEGLGQTYQFLPSLIIKDENKSVLEGAFSCINDKGALPYSQYGLQELRILASHYQFEINKPWKELTQKQQGILLNGSGEEKIRFVLDRVQEGKSVRLQENRPIRGMIQALERIYHFTKSKTLHKYMLIQSCPECDGKRLRKISLNIKFRKIDIGEMSRLTVAGLKDFFQQTRLPLEQQEIGRDLLKEIQLRLSFLSNVGLDYLTIDRPMRTLSGGEAQRIRLARQVGSGLTGVLYVLDEPSIGLHPRDNQQLLSTLKNLKEMGNTVFVIEHDEETLLAADHIVDIGPGAGRLGGEVLVNGSLADLMSSENSLTGQYLSGKKTIPVPKERRTFQHEICLKGATLHNLKQVDCSIPLGILVCMTGVSGSGKSTLMHLLLKQAVLKHFGQNTDPLGSYKSISGLEHLDQLIEIDQSPIGRTPRSNPATYTGVFDEIRKLFSSLPESKACGYKEGRFSFNVKGGRCETCQGGGYITIDMHFLPDVEVPCSECETKRFNEETLQIRYKGKNIYDILGMTVLEALEFFQNFPKIKRSLQTLNDVGLSYIHLGQKSTTLSGGEAQRIKLAYELQKRSTGKTLYLLDEPTTGLHFDDIQKLLRCLNDLVEQGNTVLVIEHNLDVIKTADYLIDLGPEGGEGGGKIIFSGTPEEMAKIQKNYTAQALIPYLKPKKKIISSLPTYRPTCQADPESRHFLSVKGARKNNLKEVHLKIPKHKITVFSGVSGSGKTSLAFDTIFAEGQSRFVESLSTYARRFLGRLDKAEVDSITGLQPAIAIDQRSCSRNPRSTVATLTELYDYFRILYAQVGTPFCPHCNLPLMAHSPQFIFKNLIERFSGEKGYILYPIYQKGKKLLLSTPNKIGEVAESFQAEGYLRILVNHEKEYLLTEIPKQLRDVQFLDLVLDRIVVKNDQRSRIVDSLELGYRMGKNQLKVQIHEEVLHYHLLPNCTQCGFRLKEKITPKMFSFNSWQGGCPACQGLGFEMSDVEIDSEEEEKKQDFPEQKIPCVVCQGERLSEIPRHVRIQEYNISKLCEKTPTELLTFFKQLSVPAEQQPITKPLLEEIEARLQFLMRVGLDYLGLSRTGDTLSGGEAQRIRLATQMGNKLTGVLYVMDEPTVGLHPRDIQRLQKTIESIRDLGNTVLLVEHDDSILRSADYIVDFGPLAGAEGGRIIAMTTPEELEKNPDSLTGQYLSGALKIEIPKTESINGKFIRLYSASTNNLKDVSVEIPTQSLIVVTGVSGSGKSSLIMQTMVPLLHQYRAKKKTSYQGATLQVPETIQGFQVIDQSPIGRTPKSTPATFCRVMDGLRDFFAQLPESRQRGYTKARFSFNNRSGRCQPCEGMGQKKIEMHFLSDVYVLCEFCKGQRYNPNTLEVRYKGFSIADILNQTADQLLSVFEHHPKIRKQLQILHEVGLGYIRLGQSATTLSGGEAQRLKLAKELASRSKQTLYILDEPTVGLHPYDIQKLMNIFHRLVTQGHTILVIEHNLEVIRLADHVIDLGPEGGDGGGKVLFEGTPEALAKCSTSSTGKFLSQNLKQRKKRNYSGTSC